MYTSANTWIRIHQASFSCWILIQNNKFMQRTKNAKPVTSKLQHGQTDRQCHYNPLEQSGPSCSSSEEKGRSPSGSVETQHVSLFCFRYDVTTKWITKAEKLVHLHKYKYFDVEITFDKT
jgi:hypothetical protein